MYLLDTNIFLELLLDQERADDVEKLLRSAPRERFHISEFSLYSVGIDRQLRCRLRSHGKRAQAAEGPDKMGEANGGDTKMRSSKTTPAQIRERGIEALVKALGPVGMARFLQQFEMGSGDYTQDREEWLKGLTVDQVVGEIKRRRADRDL